MVPMSGDDLRLTSEGGWFNSIRDHLVQQAAAMAPPPNGLQALRRRASVVRRKTGFNSRADL
jgi:hypothetical protein